MTAVDLASLTVGELVDRFVDLSKQEANLLQSCRATTTLFPRQQAVEVEFRKRGVDARRTLLPLLTFPSAWWAPMLDPTAAQVRLNAARELLLVEPDRAMETLNSLARTGPEEQRFRANMLLSSLKEETFKPT